MRNVTVGVLRAVIAFALIGSLIVQLMIVPAIWRDLDDAATAPRVTFVTLIVLIVVCMQIFGVCVWQLLTKVRRGSVFSSTSFRYVDTIIGSISAAAASTFATAVLLAPGGVAPGIVGLICGASLVLGGMALLVVVMKALLRQAIEREHEASALRSELNEMI